MNNRKENNKKITFEITEKVGVLYENPNGWKKELNLVSWNGKEPKYDIREWNEEHTKMSKGITLHRQEVNKLYKMLKAKADK